MPKKNLRTDLSEGEKREIDVLVGETLTSMPERVILLNTEDRIKWLKDQGVDVSRLEAQKKYNHAFTIGFSIESDNEGGEVTASELLEGLRKRYESMMSDGDQDIVECCGMPFDSYENE